MDKLIPTLYRDYGMYVNKSRAFCLDVDGLKPVERRVLLSAYFKARDKYVKSAKIDGECLGRFHPHASAYGTICQMVNQGFLEGQGNFGNNIGVEPSPPAAMRYTECKLSKLIFDISLRLIDYVNWVPSELDDEPEYFPSMFPLCFLGKTFTSGIGFGYRATIPCYSITDLKNRLLYLLGKTKDKPTIKPYTDGKLLSTDKEFEDLLTTGKTKITFQGIYKIDNIKCKAIIKSFPYGKDFNDLLKKFEKELGNQDIGWIDESSNENHGTHIVFEVLKLRNRDQIFKSFVKKLNDVMISSVSFDTIVVDSKTRNVKNSSIDDMLLNTYQIYKNVNLRMLKEIEKKLNMSLRELNILEKIKIVLPKYLKEKELNIEEAIEKISEEIKEDKLEVREIFQKYKIAKLLTFKVDVSELIEKLNIIKNNIENIDLFVVGQYERI